MCDTNINSGNPSSHFKNTHLVINSGYIPLVIRKTDCLSPASVHPNLLAISGRYHTGSIAAFEHLDYPDGRRTLPSGTSHPVAMASRHSGRLMWACVTAMVGRMSKPLVRYLEK